MSVLELRDVHRTHGNGETAVHALRRRRPDGRAGRARRRHGAVRLRQVDAAEPRRRSGPADQRRGRRRGPVLGDLNRRAARRRPAPHDRLRVPGPQPAAQPDRGGERRPAAGTRRRHPCARPGRRRSPRWPRSAWRICSPLPRRDVRRPAAARRDRPGAGRRAPAGARRRADRRAGLGRPARRCCGCCGHGSTRARPACSSRTRRGTPAGPTGWSSCATASSWTRPVRCASRRTCWRTAVPAMRSWLVALRIARREARRAKGRTLAVVAMIALPVAALSFAAARTTCTS